MPNGVSSPCGLVTSTWEPTVAPRLSAMSLPSTIGGMAATRCRTPARESGDPSAGRALLPARFDSGVDPADPAGAARVAGPEPSEDGDEPGSVRLSSNAVAEPSFTVLSKSPTLRSYDGITPLSTAPRARGPREIRTCSKIAGAAATTCGCFERRSSTAGQSLMPSSATRIRLMCEVEPSKRCCKSWRNPLLMANATIREATPAATPAIEMPVIMPIKAWRRLARKYRRAIKSSKRMNSFSAVSYQPRLRIIRCMWR